MTNATVTPLPANQSRLSNELLDKAELDEINQRLEVMTAQQRVSWALENLPQNIMLSSSFGIQAAVMLHLVTEQCSDIPVVLTDTGYLFPETYHFADELVERLGLNLKIYRSTLSAAWQEARFGKLWEQGEDGITQYNQMNKVEPMKQAQRELQVSSWFAGLRRTQSDSRKNLSVLQQLSEKVQDLSGAGLVK